MKNENHYWTMKLNYKPGRLLIAKNKSFLVVLSLLMHQAAPVWSQQVKNHPENKLVEKVNVFLGSSGDQGQMSPAAGSPFGMMSIVPQTYPNTHTGYEHYAKWYKGFAHTIVEGVGCMGSGGHLLVRPFLGTYQADQYLERISQQAGPGWYQVSFGNGIQAALSANDKSGIHQYAFPAGKKGLYIDLLYALANGVTAGEYKTEQNSINGWLEARTTCGAGRYKLFYCLQFSREVRFEELQRGRLLALLNDDTRELQISVGISSVSTAHAVSNCHSITQPQMKELAAASWQQMLSRISAKGSADKVSLFYSLLYRTMQSPFNVSEKDGSYKGQDGMIHQSKDAYYNGWAIWDNYRTQLPLLSVIDTARYRQMIQSLAGLYKYGKKNFAGPNEPSNTVRTEHAVVVLLDALRKGYNWDYSLIRDSLFAEAEKLDFSKPDKALESCYDLWALASICQIKGDTAEARQYFAKAAGYKQYWQSDFADISKRDVDQIGARGMYQGTIWQYRWLVPYDVKGLMDLMGGDSAFNAQLSYFFDRHLYNHGNETDLQAPTLFNAGSKPWLSQRWTYDFAGDTVSQVYFNDNMRGIEPYVGPVYRNEPKAYLRTMDDDAGAMSAWYVWAACGLMPACIGWPVYYMHVPQMQQVSIGKLHISVRNYAKGNKYIQQVRFNGQPLKRNYLTHREIMQGGQLEITAGPTANPKAFDTVWTSSLSQTVY